MVEIASPALPAVVLVHGAFVDGSSWEGVYKILKRDGYHASVVQNPTISLADDVAATKRILELQSRPVILVGHSYGGAVITEAGNHPRVVGIVYIAAFAPDRGESVTSILKDTPPGSPGSSILPPQDGFLFQDKTKFPSSFGADLEADKAAFMADAQVPWGEACASGMVTEPAWRTKPSWYLIATEDRMIPLPTQHFMSERARSTIVEEQGSHAIYISKPEVVAKLIEKAASSVEFATKPA